MNALEWNDGMATGISLVDKRHRELVVLIDHGPEFVVQALVERQAFVRYGAHTCTPLVIYMFVCLNTRRGQSCQPGCGKKSGPR